MDRLNSFSRVIVDSTQELCAMLVSSYIEKVKETCKNGKNRQQGRRRACSHLLRILFRNHMSASWLTSFLCHTNEVTRRSRQTANTPRRIFVPTESKLHMKRSKLSCFIRHWNIFSSISDKMGIKTTVHEIVAAKQNMLIPDPETHADFLKCRCFISPVVWAPGRRCQDFEKCWGEESKSLGLTATGKPWRRQSLCAF